MGDDSCVSDRLVLRVARCTFVVRFGEEIFKALNLYVAANIGGFGVSPIQTQFWVTFYSNYVHRIHDYPNQST